MNGDFSRWRGTNARARGYTGVLIQQGRLYTDSDWNENVQIQTERAETALADLIGPAGTPKDRPGFTIAAAAGGTGGFRIGAGAFYVNGLKVENPAITDYDTQSGDLSLPAFSDGIANGDEVLIYLEAWKGHVNAFDDVLLNDPALSGADTGTRIKARWRVGVRAVTLTDAERETLIARARCGMMPDGFAAGPGTGRMAAGTNPADPADATDCLIPPEAGYLSQENQLYRIAIVEGGARSAARFVWSRENGHVEAALALNTDGDLVLRGARDDANLGFVNGGWVEVFDERNRALGTVGVLSRIDISAQNGTVSFDNPAVVFADLINPRVRRWDHGGLSDRGRPLSATPTLLEHGVTVSFTTGEYRVGDVWMFEARAATGTIIWTPMPSENPNDPVPPMSWGRHFAPLALARRQGNTIGGIIDIRPLIPPLVCLEAEDVRFDDSMCNLGAETVQEALEALCQQTTGAGLCTFVIGDVTELIDVVTGLPPGRDVKLCLRAGQFALPGTLEFTGLGHVTVEGTGPQTVVSVAGSEAAFLFRDCTTVRVTDMSINGGRIGTDAASERDGRRGAVSAFDCGDSSFERLRLRCRNGRDRAAACLATRNDRGRPSVLVRDCKLRVGQSQIGINIIDAARARVQDNDLRPADDVGRRGVLSRITADPVLVARLSRGILWFSDNRAGNLGQATVIPEGRRGAGPRDTQRIGFHELRGRVTREAFALERRGRSITANLRTDIADTLAAELRRNEANHIDDAGEMRRHIRNVLGTAIRNNGRVRIGAQTSRVIDMDRLAIAEETFMAQGIVVAGRQVTEAQVSGNTITRATDGIRIAASTSNDREPPRWRDTRPDNRVIRAIITGNVIEVRPLATTASAFGIFLGHADRVSASENLISGPGGISDNDRPRPHYGLYQFGWRGAHLTWSMNGVEGLYNGYFVGPETSSQPNRRWQLRDNATSGTVRAYVLAPDVDAN
ncbi:hypothetical protein SAMN05421759_11055 [Roseivivax lentus]|uniref:Right handed beta helix region n=1 Tax=Roseivivax lentus TaxID=633194 RepID=A0A1N7NU47_9RHOB|nr:DUF6519 domain-containing protein [Roseivivax lentus]SIT01796.1 hypothetical protein SAMN05421759_11055 [Roseivivax lentus]